MAKKLKKKIKKIKEPFWKKLGPEGKHIADHVGHIVDHSSTSEVIDAFINLGLAYQGVIVSKHILGALIGPIGLKLATARNEVAGLAGVSVLAALGVCSLPWDAYAEGKIPWLEPLRITKTTEEIEELPWWQKIWYPDVPIVP